MRLDRRTKRHFVVLTIVKDHKKLLDIEKEGLLLRVVVLQMTQKVELIRYTVTSFKQMLQHLEVDPITLRGARRGHIGVRVCRCNVYGQFACLNASPHYRTFMMKRNKHVYAPEQIVTQARFKR